MHGGYMHVCLSCTWCVGTVLITWHLTLISDAEIDLLSTYMHTHWHTLMLYMQKHVNCATDLEWLIQNWVGVKKKCLSSKKHAKCLVLILWLQLLSASDKKKSCSVSSIFGVQDTVCYCIVSQYLSNDYVNTSIDLTFHKQRQIWKRPHNKY